MPYIYRGMSRDLNNEEKSLLAHDIGKVCKYRAATELCK